MAKKKGIGIDVETPKKVEGIDKKDPFTGNVTVRGRTFVGFVESTRMTKTATVIWERVKKIPKYERWEKRRTKIHAHNPPSINAKKGDRVMLVETKPLSKTKNFAIVKVLGKDVEMQLKQQERDKAQEDLSSKKSKNDEKKDKPKEGGSKQQ